MIPMTYLNIIGMAVVPCSAAGASAYIGYTYYINNSSTTTLNSNGSTEAFVDELSSTLDANKLQLKKLQTELEKQESLLLVEQKENNLAKEELIQYEIALLTKQQEDVVTKKSNYERDAQAKENHTETITSTTREKEAASTTKAQKQSAVDDQNEVIKKADEAHKNQSKVEGAAKVAKVASEQALVRATEAYNQKLPEQTTAQEKLQANTTNISSEEGVIQTKTTKKSELATAKDAAEKNEKEGKATCEEAIKEFVEGLPSCEGTITPKDGIDESSTTTPLTTYKELKEKTKSAIKALTDLEGEITSLTSTLATTKGKTQALQASVEAIKQEVQKLKDAQDAAQSKKDNDEKTHKEAQTLTTDLRTKHEKAIQDLIPLTKALEEATTAFNKLEETLNKLNTQTTEIDKAYQASTKDLEAIIGNITDKATSIKTAQEKIDAFTKDINSKKSTLTQPSTVPTSLVGKSIAEITESITEYKKNLKNSSEKIKSITDEIEHLKNTITSLNSEIDKSTVEVVGVEGVVA